MSVIFRFASCLSTPDDQRSKNDYRFRVAGLQGAHVAEDEVFGEVAAVVPLVVAAGDGEGVHDVGGVIPVQAGAQVAALLHRRCANVQFGMDRQDRRGPAVGSFWL